MDGSNVVGRLLVFVELLNTGVAFDLFCLQTVYYLYIIVAKEQDL